MALFGAPAVQGGREESGTANFPQSGLAALYKCDEREGAVLKDALGVAPPIVLSTGVIFDAVAGDCYLDDTTGLRALLDGQTHELFVLAEFTTPAATGSAKTLPLISNGSTSNYPPIDFSVNEVTGSVFNCVIVSRTLLGGSSSSLSFTFSDVDLAPSTSYQIAGRMVTATDGVVPTMYVVFRALGATGWATLTARSLTSGSAGAHTFDCHDSSIVRLLSNKAATPDTFWTGKVGFLAFGLGAPAMSDLLAVMDRPGTTNIRNILGTTTSRFWDFRYGEGDTVIERCTGAIEAVAGTAAWVNEVPGIAQPCIRQGSPYYGRPGVKIGGETGFPHGGYGATASTEVVTIDSLDGWTFQWTGRPGADPPAAIRPLVWLTAPPLTAGVPITDVLKYRGVGFALLSTGVITAHVKTRARVDSGANSDNYYAAMTSDGAVATGRLATYTIVCSAAGVVSAYRQEIGASTPTQTANNATWLTADFRLLDVTGLKLAITDFDSELLAGYIAIHNRPLSTAEMAQCHRNAIARMKGDSVYAAKAAGLFGNGSESFPYEDLKPIWRTMQPEQTVYAAAGVYADRCEESSSTLQPASQDFTFIGAGPTTTSIIAGAGINDYPYSATGGTKYWSGVKFDANDVAIRGYDTGTVEDVPRMDFTNCYFANADTQGGSGAGMVTRALYVSFLNCKAYDNVGHGVYLRINDETQGNHTVIVSGLECTGNTEDGLKFAADSTSPDMAAAAAWTGTIDKLTVDGGKNQLWLSGCKNMVITNVLLKNPTDVGFAKAQLYLGYSSLSAYEEVCDNITIANITIYGTGGATQVGIRDTKSTGVTIRNALVANCGRDYIDARVDPNDSGEEIDGEGTATLTYCAGSSATDPIATHATNIPDATITFTNAAGNDFTLAEGSDGIGTGVNLWTLCTEIKTDIGGTARSATEAWNMGAY